MTRSTPLVSVVMPAYNAAGTIEHAMCSVLAQSMSDLQLLVIDDASTDETLDVMNTIAARDRRVQVLRAPANGGAAEARNLGLDAASGVFIAFLDSDDTWMPRKLELQLPLFADPSTILVGSAYDTVDPEGNVVGGIGAPDQFDEQALLDGVVLGCLTAVFRKAALHDHVRFRPRIARSLGWIGRSFGWRPIQEDYLFWLDLFAVNKGSIGRNRRERLASYMLRPGSASAGKHRAAYFHWRILRHDIGLGWMPAARHFVRYAMAAVRKSHDYRRGAREQGTYA